MNNPSAVPDIPARTKLNFSTKLAYGAGDLGAAMTANILVFYLLFFFTEVAHIPAGLAGSILMIGKVWDAINDPIVGVLSDKTQSRWGRRYPWMLFGAVPFGVFFILQWIVPTENPWGLFWYYVIISIFFNAAYTAVNLPYTALTPELTQDYNERTSLNSFRFTFSIGGSILSVMLVILIASLVQDLRQQYLWIGVVCAVIAIASLFWCVFGTWRRATMMAQELASTQENSLPLFEQLRIAFTNRPFLYVIGIYLFSWLALQITASILKYFVVNWMGLSDQISNLVILVVQGTALLTLFMWSAVSARMGKKATYFMGMGVWILAQAGLFLLQPGQIGFMYVLAVLAGLGVSTAYLIPWSMLPDVIELDELQTGQRREGVFYAFMVLLQKIGLAVGLFLVGLALEWSGYVGGAAEQTPSALMAIRVAVGPLPTLSLILGLVLAYFYPITREAHAEILLKLHERRRAEKEKGNGL
ncbi:MFS transporter [Leptothermofonsia sichuanensis E412]|uniref:MFS transporter n=1 Tax=Leptothermofonsia sichuanensis TaxID=2917832 RepID=UPI001CA794E1|nr:MFS transporter [Leptothermofonsia sichuanensis]QZZ20683.1 MFS transporter [Leptothermofonsia sichuanensis E412]